MNKFYPALATVLLLFVSFGFVSAQEVEDMIEYIPPPGAAYVFDEYNPHDISDEDEKQKLQLFVSQVRNTPYSHGYVYIYRGATDYKFDWLKRAAKINRYFTSLTKGEEINSIILLSKFHGFRNESTIEMVVQSLRVKTPLPTSNVSLLDVKYYDDATLEKGIVQKTGQELLDSLIKRVEPHYPAAAKAMYATGEVGFLIKIDEKGNVIEATHLFGHPLLRQACEQAVKQWQFKPEKRNKVPVKVVGITVCEFLPAASKEFAF